MGATNYLQAALEILRIERRPLTSSEITLLARDRGLIRPQGKTPHATMSAALYLASRDRPECGLVKLETAGATRARRGSVRWAIADTVANR